MQHAALPDRPSRHAARHHQHRRHRRSRLALAAVSALVGVALVASMPRASGATRQIKVIRDTATITVTQHQYYGSDRRQRLNAYVHDRTVAGGRPWVIIWHGGSWENGTMDTPTAASLAQRWFDEGFNTFNAEYEPSHRADGTPYVSATTGRPVTAAGMRIDTQLAVSYVKANARAFNIDPTRGASYGFSAGGHLAALNGAYYNGVRVVVSVSGVLRPDYVKAMGETGSFAGQRATPSMLVLSDYATTLVGCPHRDWASCGASWNAFRPDRWLRAGGPAFYVVQGRDDLTLPYATLAGFTSQLRLHGIPYRSIMASGYGHTDAMIGPGTARWRDVVAYVRARTL